MVFHAVITGTDSYVFLLKLLQKFQNVNDSTFFATTSATGREQKVMCDSRLSKLFAKDEGVICRPSGLLPNHQISGDNYQQMQ